MMAKRRNLGFLLALIAAAAFAVTCSDDTTLPPDGPHPGATIQNLTQKEHVLTNIELAYNNRRINWYTGVLDANFTFYFSPSDVGGGLPEQWNRVEEITANTNLFDKGYVGTMPPCQSVYLDLRIEEGVVWIGFTPSSAPTETWYTTTLFYTFKFEISPNTYIPSPGSKAMFTVRNAGTDSAPHWQLVEMRDLGGASALQRTSGTDATTWGQIKALYR